MFSTERVVLVDLEYLKSTPAAQIKTRTRSRHDRSTRDCNSPTKDPNFHVNTQFKQNNFLKSHSTMRQFPSIWRKPCFRACDFFHSFLLNTREVQVPRVDGPQRIPSEDDVLVAVHRSRMIALMLHRGRKSTLPLSSLSAR